MEVANVVPLFSVANHFYLAMVTYVVIETHPKIVKYLKIKARTCQALSYDKKFLKWLVAVPACMFFMIPVLFYGSHVII